MFAWARKKVRKKESVKKGRLVSETEERLPKKEKWKEEKAMKEKYLMENENEKKNIKQNSL